jgi:ABC-2 type transport system permease protein
MRIIAIVLKDLKQIVQDKRSLMILIAMPVVFTLFMGFAYGKSQADPNADTRLALAWVDLDNGAALGQNLESLLSNSDIVRIEAMDEPSAMGLIQKGKIAGVLLLPAGFSQSTLKGGTGQLTLVVDPASPNGQTLYQAVRQPVTRLMSSVEIATLDVEGITAQRQLTPTESSSEFDAAFQAALAQWQQTDNAARLQTEMAVATTAIDPFGGNPYNQASPGILVMFAVFGLVTSAQIVLQERKGGTLTRMLTTSLSPSAAMAGHFLAMFILTLLQQVLLVAFGQLLLGVNYLREPLGVLAVIVALSLAIAGIGLFIGVMAKEEQQVSLYSLIIMFALSALGGAWFSLDGAGKAFATIGHLTPTAWAMTGFQNILIRGLDVFSILLPAGILLAYAFVFYLLASWRLKKTM